MYKKQLPPPRLHRVFTFINETRWIGWGLPLIGILVALVSYRVENRADRPEIHITEVYAGKVPSTPTDTTFVAKYSNDGTIAATHLTVKLGTVDPTVKKSWLLAPPYKVNRLGVGPLFRSTAEFKINRTHARSLFVICLYFTDDAGATFDPKVNFYKVSPIPMSSSDGRCCELADATVTEKDALLSWFSCANL
jgi:hypothetical protein